MNSKEIMHYVLKAMQPAEDLNGPEGQDYIDLMGQIQNEARLRQDQALETFNEAKLEERLKEILKEEKENVREEVMEFVGTEIGKLLEWTGNINDFHSAKSALSLLSSNLGLTVPGTEDICGYCHLPMKRRK